MCKDGDEEETRSDDKKPIPKWAKPPLLQVIFSVLIPVDLCSFCFSLFWFEFAFFVCYLLRCF
jgi:hypothetical protein